MRVRRSSASRRRPHRLSATSAPPRAIAARSASVSGWSPTITHRKPSRTSPWRIGSTTRCVIPSAVVLRQVDEVARPLQAEALPARRPRGRGLARQDRAAADRVGLVGLRGMGEQPPAAVLDRDRPQQLRLEVVDDVLEIRDAGKPTTGRRRAARSSRPRRRPSPRSRGPAACGRRRRRRRCSAPMYARRSSALTLTFTTPSSTAPSRSSVGQPGRAVQHQRDRRRGGDRGQPLEVQPDRRRA